MGWWGLVRNMGLMDWIGGISIVKVGRVEARMRMLEKWLKNGLVGCCLPESWTDGEGENACVTTLTLSYIPLWSCCNTFSSQYNLTHSLFLYISTMCHWGPTNVFDTSSILATSPGHYYYHHQLIILSQDIIIIESLMNIVVETGPSKKASFLSLKLWFFNCFYENSEFNDGKQY